jgi:hypothetical protein
LPERAIVVPLPAKASKKISPGFDEAIIIRFIKATFLSVG